MRKISPTTLLLAALACAPAWANTSATGTPTKPVAKKTQDKTAAARKSAATRKAVKEDAVDVADMHATAYDCDLGDRLTIYKKPDDGEQIALQWKKRTHRLTRMQTTTGAERFENPESGLVWIGIPAKGMLLDSKKGRQLANECRNEEQKKHHAQRHGQRTLVQK